MFCSSFNLLPGETIPDGVLGNVQHRQATKGQSQLATRQDSRKNVAWSAVHYAQFVSVFVFVVIGQWPCRLQ